ncbi:FAD-binding oxidoreductase [Gulosibacter sp. 10]|uniref:NAD(P)/FAD-dependent oxidoreductase n=1 Tax=Gulosibacter sp. 10 TaxID=1255570 RepID=UPI00097F1755|nr:FAD-dependent oxidoreductase [Gulosibacter sp. 10]SJM71804.1 D-amino acid dehydrogenase small subunit [Gulosibacter sp. 10]
MGRRRSALVIGAGAVGLACAFELAESGHPVTVLDAGRVGAAASAGNAGWVTPFLSTPRAAPGAVRQALQSFARPEGPARMRPHAEVGFARWIAQFLLATRKRSSDRATAALQRFARDSQAAFESLEARGVAMEYHRTGLAVVFKDAARMDAYLQLGAKVAALGYRGRISPYRGQDALEFEPALHPSVAGAVHLVDESHVRPESLTDGLAEAIRLRGGEILEGRRVTMMRLHRGGAWSVSTASGEEHRASTVVVAAGHRSRELMSQVGVRVPIESAKGTSLTASGAGTTPARALKLYESMVACSPFGDQVRLSGTYDIGVRDASLNRRRLESVVRQGRSYLRDWEPARPTLEWAGHRPTTPDDLPIIGPVRKRPGLYLATGHGTLGITLAPLTGAMLAREIDAGRTDPWLRQFNLDRFAGLVPRSF